MPFIESFDPLCLLQIKNSPHAKEADEQANFLNLN